MELDLFLDNEIPKENKFFTVTNNDLGNVNLNILLTNEGNPIDLNSVASVKLSIAKPDNKIVLQDTIITDATAGKLSVVLSEQALIVEGRHYGQALIYYNDGKVSVSQLFSYSVTSALLSNATIQSKDEFQSINKTIEEIGDIVKTVSNLEEKGEHAQTQGDYAKIQGDYASEKGADAESKAFLANVATSEANLARDNANEQAEHAKTQGDYAKTEYERLKNTDVSTLSAELAQKAQQSFAESIDKRVDELVIPLSPENANIEVTDAHVSTTKNRTFTTLKYRFEDAEKSVSAIAVETNILNTVDIVVGERIYSSGAIGPDGAYFRTKAIAVTVGDRYATVSSNLVSNPVFTFYNSSTIGSGTKVSSLGARDATVPAGATHMIIHYQISYQPGFVVQKLATGYPVFGASTLVYNDLYQKSEIYKRTEVDTITSSIKSDVQSNQNAIKTKLNIADIGIETNLIKTTPIVIGERISSTGSKLSDASYFRTETIPVNEGERYATISSNTGAFPSFSFYNEDSISAGTYLSGIGARDTVVPTGATHMVVHYLLSYQNGFIIQKLDEGYPVFGESTITYNNIYTKNVVDTKLSNKVDAADDDRWHPDTFDKLDIIDVQSNDKVLAITDNDVLYGTNSYREIFKATQYDLSDRIVVCTLNSGSTLQKLLFVSENKAVGYVVSPTEEDRGFYCFDNADTNVWTARRISKMRAGAPPLEFQGLIKTPDSQYLFACSYGTKVTDPLDTTTQAPIDIYRSVDLGESWQIIYTHHNRINQHIHVLAWDSFRDRLWGIVGDDGNGGTSALVHSDDYGDTFGVIETTHTSHMHTAILPTRRYVLFGTDRHPSGVTRWKPQQDIKNPPVSNDDIEDIYYIPVETSNTFGFARNPVVDVSSYPYKIAIPYSYGAEYSKGCVLVSPNYKDWYMLDFVDDPITNLSWSSFSGMTSDGWVLGWGVVGGVHYYRRFKFPNWVNN